LIRGRLRELHLLLNRDKATCRILTPTPADMATLCENDQLQAQLQDVIINAKPGWLLRRRMRLWHDERSPRRSEKSQLRKRILLHKFSNGSGGGADQDKVICTACGIGQRHHARGSSGVISRGQARNGQPLQGFLEGWPGQSVTPWSMMREKFQLAAGHRWTERLVGKQ
jgi:hypothetical protein